MSICRYFGITLLRYHELLINQMFRKQSFAFGLCDATATAIVSELHSVNASNGEIACLGMTDEESADRCTGLNRVVVGKGDV